MKRTRNLDFIKRLPLATYAWMYWVCALHKRLPLSIRAEVFGYYAQSTATVVTAGKHNRDQSIFKTHYSDNKVKCLELKDRLSWNGQQNRKYTRWKRSRNKITICNKLVLPCNTDLSACNFTNSAAFFSLLLLELTLRWLNNNLRNARS